MKYCTHCGKELVDDAIVCTNCGCAANGVGNIGAANSSADMPNVGLNLLGFFIPIVGLILYCTMQAQTPRKANQIGLFSLIGFVVNLFLILMIYFM